MPTFPLTWYAIAALVVTNLITGALYRYEAHKVETIELRSEIAAQETERMIAEQKQITEDTTNAWKAALDVTRNDWARRLRNANVQPMPGISGPAGGIDGLATDSLALAAQCAETTEQLLTLQGWIKKQERVK